MRWGVVAGETRETWAGRANFSRFSGASQVRGARGRGVAVLPGARQLPVKATTFAPWAGAGDPGTLLAPTLDDTSDGAPARHGVPTLRAGPAGDCAQPGQPRSFLILQRALSATVVEI